MTGYGIDLLRQVSGSLGAPNSTHDRLGNATGTLLWRDSNSIDYRIAPPPRSNDDVSTPPTDAELDTAFGTPATVGFGFVGVLNDNGADSNAYLCFSTGSSWFYAVGTLAI